MSGPGVKAANPSKEVKWFVGYTALCAGVDGRDAEFIFLFGPTEPCRVNRVNRSKLVRAVVSALLKKRVVLES